MKAVTLRKNGGFVLHERVMPLCDFKLAPMSLRKFTPAAKPTLMTYSASLPVMPPAEFAGGICR
ncbi:MAG: hypothetical protein KDF59_05220 [Nitrosomonas sp.]|nr:hypothetical protein [Nitrosomonas sp.]